MDVSTVTTSDGSLLRSVRTTLAESEEALLCVAFASEQGIHLLSRELQQLSSNARLLVTTAFGTTRPAALNMALELGVRVAVFNPPGTQTFHPIAGVESALAW